MTGDWQAGADRFQIAPSGFDIDGCDDDVGREPGPRLARVEKIGVFAPEIDDAIDGRPSVYDRVSCTGRQLDVFMKTNCLP
jgi:hypothetical protein